MTVGMLALIIVAVLLTQVSVVALVGLYRRKRQYREMDVRVSKPQDLLASQEIVPSNADEPDVAAAPWDGFREFRVQRREIEDGNRSICSFYLVPEAQGIEVESGCLAGSCGCCQTTLETGEIEYSQQPDADVEPGRCLLCISTPKGDLTLAA